ncbi:MAG TPA: hypothetical protein VL737_03145 [Candidatus Pristimantibacillus sp.]|jgi:hypothetical protein|nr:hypothetical protein [Candidatus Pristimantibacillus sp.]
MTEPKNFPPRQADPAEMSALMGQQFCGDYISLSRFNITDADTVVLDEGRLAALGAQTDATAFDGVVDRLYDFLDRPNPEPEVLLELPEEVWRGDRLRPTHQNGVLLQLRNALGIDPRQFVRDDTVGEGPHRDKRGTVIRKVSLRSQADLPGADPLPLLLIEEHGAKMIDDLLLPIRRISLALGLPERGATEEEQIRVMNLVNRYNHYEGRLAMDYISGMALLGDTPEAIIRSGGLNRWTAPTYRDIWLATHLHDPVPRQTREDTVYLKRFGSIPLR